MFKFKESTITGYFEVGSFKIYLENGDYNTSNKDVLKALKADSRFEFIKPINKKIVDAVEIELPSTA